MSRELKVNRFTTTAQGLVPAPATSTGLFLRDDATWAAAGSSGGGGNITPDTHPATANPANDEFEVGSVLDTTGARFSGATAWTLHNPTPTTAMTTVAGGAIVFGGANQGINNETVAVQAINTPASSWEFRAKQLGVSSGSTGLGANQPTIGGFFVGIGSTGQGYYFFRYTGQPTWVYITTQVNYAATGGTLNVIGANCQGLTNLGDFFSQAMYYRVSFNASTTKLTFFISFDGILWVDVFDTTIGSAYVTPDSVGLCVCSNTNDAQQVAWDWFRRTT